MLGGSISIADGITADTPNKEYNQARTLLLIALKSFKLTLLPDMRLDPEDPNPRRHRSLDKRAMIQLWHFPQIR